MQSQSRRFMAGGLAALMGASLLAGCSGTAPTTGATSAGASAAAEPVTIRVASVYVAGHSMNKVFVDALDAFKAKHPNVTIQQEFLPAEQLTAKLKTDGAAANLPDVFPVWETVTNVERIQAGQWMDLAPEMTTDAAWKSSFSGGTLESFQYADAPGQWAAPLGKFGLGFYYNKDLFAKAKVTPPTTWDELLTAVDSLKAAGITPWEIGAKDAWRSGHLFTTIYFKSNGVEKARELQAGTLKYDDPSFLDAYTKIKELSARGAFEKDAIGVDYASEGAAFGAGKAAMQFNGTWAIGEIANTSIKDKAGFFPFPEINPAFANNWFAGVNEAYAVRGDLTGAKKDLVIALLKDITSPAFAKRMGEETGNIPVVTAELDASKSGELLPTVLTALATADALGTDLNGYEPNMKVGAELYVGAQGVLGQQLTPEDAVKNVLKAAALNK